MEFACVRLPIPKEAITANRAKANPKAAPNFLCLKPRRIVYIGPPDISPASFTSRYLIASIHSLNFEVSPKKAESHIHTRAPGPPETMAVATPTIFPVPIVAARAVVSAEKGEISPSPRFVVRDSFLKQLFNAYGRFRHPKKCVRKVRYIPVPTNRINMTGPQTILSMTDKRFPISFIKNLL